MTQNMRLALLGRPNVGKSTLFNRLCGKKLALVFDQPGVTRDWRSGLGRLFDISFEVVDTPGLDGFEDDTLKKQIEEQTHHVISSATHLAYLVDASEGLLHSDLDLLKKIRLQEKPVIMIINKAEQSSYDIEARLQKHGFDSFVVMSAKHGLGLDDLYRCLSEASLDLPSESIKRDSCGKKDTPLQMAFMGRPNVGKSSLINGLLGYKRVLVDDKPGVTRDTIRTPFTYKGTSLVLMDTAGLRKKARIEDPLEKACVQDSFFAMTYAQCVVLVLDATQPLQKQDLILAEKILEEGRCLVVALNKADLVDRGAVKKVRDLMQYRLPQGKAVPVIPMSAKEHWGYQTLVDKVLSLTKLWSARLPTSDLNQWLSDALLAHPLPLIKGRRQRIKYITQIKSRPPSFVMFATQSHQLPESYVRYLKGSLQKDFGLEGVPLRMWVRSQKNPYVASKK